MSLQINLSSREIAQAYQDIVNGDGIDWAILTYEGGTNDLKVQAKGDGGLEELEDEFSDGRWFRFLQYHYFISFLSSYRMQYAFARVIDPNVWSTSFILE